MDPEKTGQDLAGKMGLEAPHRARDQTVIGRDGQGPVFRIGPHAMSRATMDRAPSAPTTALAVNVYRRRPPSSARTPTARPFSVSRPVTRHQSMTSATSRAALRSRSSRMIRRQIMPVTGRAGSTFKSGTVDGFAVRGHVGYPVDPDVGLVEKAGQGPSSSRQARLVEDSASPQAFSLGNFFSSRTRTRRPSLAA